LSVSRSAISSVGRAELAEAAGAYGLATLWRSWDSGNVGLATGTPLGAAPVLPVRSRGTSHKFRSSHPHGAGRADQRDVAAEACAVAAEQRATPENQFRAKADAAEEIAA
jgi:hypothetical protein